MNRAPLPITFLSPDDWLGFSSGDWAELGFAAFGLVLLFLFRPSHNRSVALRYRTGWCMFGLTALPIALRLALLPWCPIPVGSGADDFGYLLLADTLRHFRLSNPPHLWPVFFEQIFVLQRPTYSSMFNLGQGMALALGWALFGHPWAGVLMSIGALCALCYWMLLGWTTPGWSLVGGLLAMMELGPLSYWTNSYWGGAVSACAGCLVFGSLPRMAEQHRKRDAGLLGLGLGIQLLTRPFEFFLLLLVVILFFPAMRDWRKLAFATLVVSPVGCLLLFQNKAVTGSWTTTPYLLYRHEYGIPATFTFQRNAIPHAELNAEQELDYKAETIIHGDTPETFHSYWDRLVFRVRFYRFFLFAPLYLAAVAFLFSIRSYRQFWVALAILTFALGSNFYPYFYPHYIAAITCLFVLVSVRGLDWLCNSRSRGGAFLLLLCGAQFIFFYAMHGTSKYKNWDYINFGDPQGRIGIDHQLGRLPGKLLVFVHYAPNHMFAEWIHNSADIDASKVVWVRDVGLEENQKLRRYYADRTALLLKPDETPPLLMAYPTPSGPFQDVQ